MLSIYVLGLLYVIIYQFYNQLGLGSFLQMRQLSQEKEIYFLFKVLQLGGGRIGMWVLVCLILDFVFLFLYFFEKDIVSFLYSWVFVFIGFG